MSLNFGSGNEKPEGVRDERIVRILERFSHLSPERQEEVMKFLDYLEKKVADEEKSGQTPDNS